MEIERVNDLIDELYGLPWLPYGATPYLQDIINNTVECRVFEWGAGSSSIFFTNEGCQLTSVEHDGVWLKEIVKRMKYPERWTWVFAEFRGDWSNFANAILKEDGFFDIILIDGAVIDDKSSRKLCVPNAIAKVAKNGCIILDNSDTSIEEAAMLKSSCSSYTLIYGQGYLGKWETGFYFYE